MRFLTKAKPVKIRITSGGEEHFSLESLKKNFCVEDVISILDERLVRWLKQLNENKLADDIECLINEHVSNKDELTLKIHQIFFKDYKFYNIFELEKYWKKDPLMSKNYQYLIKTILYKFSGINRQYEEFIINYFEDNYPFKRDDINFCEIYNNRFKGKSYSEKIDIFAALCKCKGICGFKANKHEGLELLRNVQTCYKFQNEEINEVIENLRNRQIPQTRYELFNSFDPKKRTEWKCNYWRKYEYEDKNKIPASIADLTESESIIFDFIRSCVLILHDKKNNTNDYNINSFNIDQNDILAFEKQTVNILIGRSSNREIVEYLKKYDKYHIAQVLSEYYQFGKKLNDLVEILLDKFIEEGIKDDINITFTPYNKISERNYDICNNIPVYNEPSTRNGAFSSFPLEKLRLWENTCWKNYKYSEGKYNLDTCLTEFEKEIFSFIHRCVYLLDRKINNRYISDNDYKTKYVKRDFLEFEINTFFKILNCSEDECKEFLVENQKKHLLAKDMLSEFTHRVWDKKSVIIYFLDNFVSKAQEE